MRKILEYEYLLMAIGFGFWIIHFFIFPTPMDILSDVFLILGCIRLQFPKRSGFWAVISIIYILHLVMLLSKL